MSSHHIVRDEQEPALYIHSADNFTLEALGDLLEWSPTVIVNTSVFSKVVAFGIKVDGILGTLAADEAELLQSQEPIRRFDTGDSGLIGLLQTLYAEKYQGLNVATLEEDAPSVLIGLNAYSGSIDCTLLTMSMRAIRLRHALFEKWVTGGSFEILVTGRNQLSTTGFDEDLDGAVLDKVTLKKTDPGMIRVRCETPPYWFVERVEV